MLRILHIILILSILITQSAWAIQGGDFDVDDNKNTSGQIHSLPTDQHNDSSDHCNHFCHAGGHFVGLFALHSFDMLTTHDKHEFTFKDCAISLNHQPPIPPPIS